MVDAFCRFADPVTLVVLLVQSVASLRLMPVGAMLLLRLARLMGPTAFGLAELMALLEEIWVESVELLPLELTAEEIRRRAGLG